MHLINPSFSLKNIFLLIVFAFGINANADSNKWNTSEPETEGIDLSVLKDLHQEFKNGIHGYIDSFLVIRNGNIVFEEYYQNNYVNLTKNRKNEQAKIMRNNYGDLAKPRYNYYNPEWHPFYQDTDLHTIQSVSKSVTSALIGIAIERAEIPDINTKIIDYFPEYKSLFKDPMKQFITIKDLLTMTAGIRWDESSYAYTDPLNNAASMENSHDWIEYILALPMQYKPGDKFVYNSGITILLSYILNKATGMPVDQYAKVHLFEPLGIQNFYWKKTPTNLTDTEGGLYLSSRDFAKIGFLYLMNGVWKENQILSKEWVESTMSPDTLIQGSSRKYGYQWWLVPYAGGKEKWMYSGSGYGGQYLLVVPEYDLIMVFNGWNIFDTPRPTIEYLSARVLKAVLQ